jgi:hypothetical protein
LRVEVPDQISRRRNASRMELEAQARTEPLVTRARPEHPTTSNVQSIFLGG